MELENLYQEIILDHAKKPRHFGLLADATHRSEGHNPLCGDQVTLTLEVRDGVITEIGFEGCGCAIALATASLMSSAIQGKSTDEALQFSQQVLQAVTSQCDDTEPLGDLAALTGVRRFPMRVKCATLALHAIQDALTSGSIERK